MTRVSIVTCWLEHPELLPAYEAAVSGAGAEVVIVDQASDADTATRLDAMCERLGNGSRVLHQRENLYFAAGNNVGLAATTGDVVLMLNNDIVGSDARRPARWLHDVERETPADALVGPTVCEWRVDAMRGVYVEGWCVAARRSTWAALEGWDAQHYPRAYSEDVDLSWRAVRAGYALGQTAWAVRHLQGVTNQSTVDGYAFIQQQHETFCRQVREAVCPSS
jgi:GT2 family glycosyltransferase